MSKARSILRVLVSANGTLVIDVLHAGNVEWKWEDTEFKRNVLLLNAGIWSVKIRNNSTTSCCDYISIIRLKELHLEPRKPYIWLRLPLLISGGLSISLVVPIYFSNKFKNRLNKKAIKIIIAVIITFGLVFSYQLAGLILHTSTPWVVSEGVSMEPAINFGDLVIMMGAEPQNLLPDDIILFQKIGLDMGGEDFSTMSAPVLHRIVYITEIGNHRYFKTKGDNSEKTDEWFVPDEGVLGKAALVVPKLGFVLLMLERIEVKLFIIAIIFSVFFIWPSIKPKKREGVSPVGKSEI